ncbi:MAG: pyrimidine dimer DNA glycosylase/endonuclease V [Promethearchaeota archaeon]
MWGIDPELLCNKHLLGEHVEMQMFVGTLFKGKSIQGYINRGLVNPKLITERHNDLADEMIKRGMNHNSKLQFDSSNLSMNHRFSLIKNKQELIRRCPDCKKRIIG